MNLLVIPARWGSTRFPGKPLAMIGGLPMVVRTWRACRRAMVFDEVVVATDDVRVYDECQRSGCNSIMTGECRNGTERCAEAAIKGYGLADDELVVNVQGDEPLMDPVIPQRVLMNLKLRPERVWTAVRDLKLGELENPNIVRLQVRNEKAWNFSRYDDLVSTHAHLGIYGYSVAKLREYSKKEPDLRETAEGLEQLRWSESLSCITVDYDGIGVDRAEDIARVEERLRSNRRHPTSLVATVSAG